MECYWEFATALTLVTEASYELGTEESANSLRLGQDWWKCQLRQGASSS